MQEYVIVHLSNRALLNKTSVLVHNHSYCMSCILQLTSTITEYCTSFHAEDYSPPFVTSSGAYTKVSFDWVAITTHDT